MQTMWPWHKDEQWPSSHQADCEQNDGQKPVKTLPSIAIGKNGPGEVSDERLCAMVKV